MKTIKIIFNWLIFLAIIAGICALFHYWHPIAMHLPVLPTMTGLQVLFFGLAIAFTWVEVLKWGKRKPFNCLKCMTGWVSLILAFSFHVELWPLYLPAGLFVGAVFSAIQMRYL